jgi:hypothetical protein
MPDRQYSRLHRLRGGCWGELLSLIAWLSGAVARMPRTIPYFKKDYSMNLPTQSAPVARIAVKPDVTPSAGIAPSDCCGAGKCCVGACLPFGAGCAGICVPNIGQC